MWLHILQFRFYTRNMLRLASSASAHGIFFEDVSQFCLRTKTILWLGVLSPASAQGIYCALKFSSSASAHRIICDLKFHSFEQYTVTWSSAVGLPQEKTSLAIPHFCFCTRTLLFFRKFTLIPPPPISCCLTWRIKSKKISNDQELIQSDPTSCPQNQKGNN